MKNNFLKKGAALILSAAMAMALYVSPVSANADIPDTSAQSDTVIPLAHSVYLDADRKSIAFNEYVTSGPRASKGTFIEFDISSLIGRKDIESVKYVISVNKASNTSVYMYDVPSYPTELDIVGNFEIKNHQDKEAVYNSFNEIRTTINADEERTPNGTFVFNETGMQSIDITNYIKNKIDSECSKAMIYFTVKDSSITDAPVFYTGARQDASSDGRRNYLSVSYKDISSDVLSEINSAESAESLAAVLDKYADTIGIDFELLCGRTDAVSGMVGKTYSSYAEIKTVFNAAVSDALKIADFSFDKVMNFNQSTLTDDSNNNGDIWIQAGRKRGAYLQKNMTELYGKKDFIAKVYLNYYYSNYNSDNVIIKGLDYLADVTDFSGYENNYYNAPDVYTAAMVKDSQTVRTKVSVDVTDYVKSKINNKQWVNISICNFKDNVGNSIYGGGNTDYKPTMTVVYDQKGIDEYNEQVILNEINSAGTEADLKSIIDENYEAIGIERNPLYNMSVVYAELINKDYSTISEFKNAYNSLVSKYIVSAEIPLYNYGVIQTAENENKVSFNVYGAGTAGTRFYDRWVIANYKISSLNGKKICKASFNSTPVTSSENGDTITKVYAKFSNTAFSKAFDEAIANKTQFNHVSLTDNEIGKEIKSIFDSSSEPVVYNENYNMVNQANASKGENLSIDVTEGVKTAAESNSGNLTMFINSQNGASIVFNDKIKVGNAWVNATPASLVVYYDISDDVYNAVAAVNNADDISAVAAAISENADVFGIDLNGKFAALGDNQKQIIFSTIFDGRPYNNIYDVKSVFDNALSKIEVPYFTIISVSGCNELVYEDTSENGTNGQFYVGSVDVKKNMEYSGNVAILFASYRNGVLESVKEISAANAEKLITANVGSTVTVGANLSLTPKLPTEIKAFIWNMADGAIPLSDSKTIYTKDYPTYSAGEAQE